MGRRQRQCFLVEGFLLWNAGPNELRYPGPSGPREVLFTCSGWYWNRGIVRTELRCILGQVVNLSYLSCQHAISNFCAVLHFIK